MKSSRAVVRGSLARTACAGLLLVLAATAVNCDSLLPRHRWSEEWGPMIPHDTFPGDCALCHTTGGWDTIRADFSFDHEKETGYALVGAHETANCIRCHNDYGAVMDYVARGCGGCHPSPHKATLGIECNRCHDEESWEPSGLLNDHSRTSFPLVGLHAVSPCDSCHPKASIFDYRGAPTRCELCHRDDALAVQVPDHVAQGLTRDCESCHSPLGWER